MRLLRLTAVCAVIAGSIVGFGAAPASAGELCEEAGFTGAVTTALGPRVPTYTGDCTPFDYGTLCHTQEVAAEPMVYIDTYNCVPDPVSAP